MVKGYINKQDKPIMVKFDNEHSNIFHKELFWVDSRWTDEEILQFLQSFEYDILLDCSYEELPDDEDKIAEFLGVGLTKILWCDITNK